MAIKGKSKPKARRAVTPGPRPVYVPVKRPLLQRRGFQIGVLAIVVVAAVAAIAYGFIRERDQNRERALAATMKSVSSEYNVKIQTAIAGVGQVQTPGTAFVLLPDLTSQIDALRSGSADAAAVAKAAEGLSGQATTAADQLAKIDPAAMVRGKGIEDPVFVRDLINARFKMENGLRMDAVAADLLAQAATASGQETTALLDQADEARTTAETVFGSGYQDWVNAQFAAGTYRPTNLTPGAGAGS
jgi:hypothetical protein